MPDDQSDTDFRSGENLWIACDCERCPVKELKDFDAVVVIEHPDGREEALCTQCLAADPDAEVLVVMRRVEPWCEYCYIGGGKHQDWCRNEARKCLREHECQTLARVDLGRL